LDKEISKLLEDSKESDKDCQAEFNEEFVEPSSIWDLKERESSTQFTQNFANLVKKETEKSSFFKPLPTINTDFHNTSSTSTQADFISKSKNITPTSRISPIFQNMNILQNLNSNYPSFFNVNFSINLVSVSKHL